jgi:divalent metal cation (Fe/Co/Zn/Cd) transporter
VDSTRERGVALALRLSVFTVVWNLVFGGLAIAVAAGAGSPSLIGFGLDAIVDATASAVLVWRFRVEASDEARAQKIEAIALRVVGIALVCAGVYVSLRSVQVLADRSRPEASGLGLTLSAASAIVLPFLALAKFRVAERLDSVALRSDSLLTGAAGLLALFSLTAIALDAIGLWWADPIAALLIAVILFIEGTRSVLRPPEGR